MEITSPLFSENLDLFTPNPTETMLPHERQFILWMDVFKRIKRALIDRFPKDPQKPPTYVCFQERIVPLYHLFEQAQQPNQYIVSRMCHQFFFTYLQALICCLDLALQIEQNLSQGLLFAKTQDLKNIFVNLRFLDLVEVLDHLEKHTAKSLIK